MTKLKGSKITAEHIVTIGDFVENVYLPWVRENKKPSTYHGYVSIWLNQAASVPVSGTFAHTTSSNGSTASAKAFSGANAGGWTGPIGSFWTNFLSAPAF